MSLKKLITMLAVLALAMVALLVFRPQVTDDAEDSLSKDSLPLETEKREILQEVQQRTSTDASSENVTEFPDASRLVFIGDCPEILDLSVVQNQECMDAVEQQFLERATYILEFVGMVPRNGRFSFQETLDNVESDRELVIEALSRPECQLLDGPIRLELREMCNAEAIFRYSHFAAICNEAKRWERVLEIRHRPFIGEMRSHYEDSLRWYRSKVDDALKDTSKFRPNDLEPVEKYYDERNKYRENLLKDMWLTSTGKCPQIRSEQNWNEADIDLPRSKTLDWWIEEPAEERLISNLRKVAARLGFERELLSKACRFQGKIAGRHTRGGCLGKEYEDSRLSLHPWSEDIAEGIDSYSIVVLKEMLPGFKRASGLILVSRGLASMENSGFEADIEWVTKFLCQDRLLANKEDCQAAIERAEKYFDATNMGALRILDRIAAKAIELNLYRN